MFSVIRFIQSAIIKFTLIVSLFDYVVVAVGSYYLFRYVATIPTPWLYVGVVGCLIAWNRLTNVIIFRVKLFKLIGALLSSVVGAWWLAPSVVQALPFVTSPLNAFWLAVVRIATVLIVLNFRVIRGDVIQRQLAPEPLN